MIGGCVGAALVAVALLGSPPNDGPPLDPRSDGPLGTSALVSLLDGLGADVELSVGLPDRGRRRRAPPLRSAGRGADERGARLGARRWHPRGHRPRLVAVAIHVRRASRATATIWSAGICTLGRTRRGRGRRGRRRRPLRHRALAYGSCFGSRDFAFVVASAEGDGDIVAIGGAAFVTNDRLAHDDNAVLAAAVLAPTPGLRVRFVDPPLPAGGGDKTLYELISDGVRRGGAAARVRVRAVRRLASHPVRAAGARGPARRDRGLRAGRRRRSPPRAWSLAGRRGRGAPGAACDEPSGPASACRPTAPPDALGAGRGRAHRRRPGASPRRRRRSSRHHRRRARRRRPCRLIRPPGGPALTPPTAHR